MKSQMLGQKVIFSSPNPDTGQKDPRVGVLLYIGNETQMITHQESFMVPNDAYPKYSQKLIGKDMIVFVVLHQPTGAIYKIYNEKDIRIFNEKQTTDGI